MSEDDVTKFYDTFDAKKWSILSKWTLQRSKIETFYFANDVDVVKDDTWTTLRLGSASIGRMI